MTQRAHPLWRGLFLSFVFALITILAGSFSISDSFSVVGFPGGLHLFAAAMVVGAFVFSLPRRIRCRRDARLRSTGRSCLTAFLGGLLMMLALPLTGADSFHLIGGMMQGGVGALAFLLCAWTSAGVTALLTGRKLS